MLKVGAGISLEQGGHSVKTIIRGWRVNSYLLVDVPTVSWRPQPGGLLCRYTLEGKYYGYTVNVLGVLAEVAQLALTYPKDVVDSNQRADERYTVSLPVQVCRTSETGDGSTAEGLITDLSKGGCKFVTHAIFGEGEVLRLEGATYTGSAFEPLQVKTCMVKEQGNVFSYGGPFIMGAGPHGEPFEVLFADLGRLEQG